MAGIEEIVLLAKAQAKIRQDLYSTTWDSFDDGVNAGLNSAIRTIDLMIKDMESEIHPMTTAG